ncbi:MAG: formate dehydrogenase accessory sulfurtransferase FdhD [Actinomycetota bacterium]|jgi:FdhD protein|nr:formate dehydrogenase accessory sulfurtransferase FdhD [Actinomycetota bacterium]
MRRPGATVRYDVVEVTGGQAHRHEDRVATEEPLELRLTWPGSPPQPLAVTMRTPGHDFELAAGFVLSEGLVVNPAGVHGIAYCTEEQLAPEQVYNTVTVTLDAPPPRPLPARFGAVAAACGICGKDSLDAISDFGGRPVSSELQVQPGVLSALPALLRRSQPVFARTGGLHAAGLFDAVGELVVAREDVGRHNAVDKVLGAAALAGTDTTAALLCTSGRAGFEIVQKAVMASIPVVVAVGAPSSLAVACAREYAVTLVGFTREHRFVVYAAPQRVRGV